MKENEHALIIKLKNQFYEDYSRLVNRTLNKVKPHLQTELEEYLNEINVYSRDETLL